MKSYTLILAMILSSSLFGQVSDQKLIEVLRSDSVHTPIKLYKDDNVRYTVLINEVLKCKDIDSLNNIKDGLNNARNTLNEEKIINLASIISDKDVELSDKERKLKRNRKGFIITSAVILVRAALRIIFGI